MLNVWFYKFYKRQGDKMKHKPVDIRNLNKGVLKKITTNYSLSECPFCGVY